MLDVSHTRVIHHTHNLYILINNIDSNGKGTSIDLSTA